MKSFFDKNINRKIKNELKSAIKRIGIPTVSSVVLFVVLLFFVIIPMFENNLMEGKKDMIQELTNSAYHVIEHEYEDFESGELTELEAKEECIEHLEGMVHGKDNLGYMWIIDRTPTVIMHPYREDFIGVNLENYTDPDGIFLFKEFATIATTKGEGFLEYKWQLNENESKNITKISYVKHFEPWDWILGTGIYVADVKKDIRKIINQIIIISSIILVIVLFISTFLIMQWYKAELERTKTQHMLENTNKKIKKIFQTKSDFVNKIAHDLKTPLSPIKMIISTFNTEKMTKIDIKKLVIIERNVKNMDSLILDLSKIARINSTREPKAQFEIYNLSDLVKSIIIEQTSVLDENNFIITTKIGKTPNIAMDVTKIREVISNLISNSMKYSKVSRRLDFLVKKKKDTIQFKLKDEGAGVDAKNLKKLFKQFYIVKETKRHDSLGLGLAICENIIKKHKGKIWAESKGVGKGTSMIFELPLKQNKNVKKIPANA